MISSSRRDCRCQTVHCGVTGTTKSTTCVFCGTVGSLSDEHVVAKWVRKALQIREPIREFSEAAYVGAAETLAIVFHEVCVSCNTGWMESLERDACPVLGPLLLGAAPGTSRVLDPDQQAILATWAVKTSLLLALSKFRGQDYGWIPASTLQWLYRHHDARMPLRHPSVASPASAPPRFPRRTGRVPVRREPAAQPPDGADPSRVPLDCDSPGHEARIFAFWAWNSASVRMPSFFSSASSFSCVTVSLGGATGAGGGCW